jgi:hypothetical protein
MNTTRICPTRPTRATASAQQCARVSRKLPRRVSKARPFSGVTAHRMDGDLYGVLAQIFKTQYVGVRQA